MMSKMNRKCCYALLLLLSVMFAAPVMAEGGPGIKITRIESSTYTGVANYQASQSSAAGIKRSAKAPTGMMFVMLDMDLAGTWDEKTTRHQVNQRNLLLTDESGANYTPIGRVYHGSYSPSPSGVFMSRATHLFKDNPNYETFFNYMPVFLVPEKTRKVSFKLDKFDSKELELTEAKAEMGIIKMPKIQVLGAKQVSEVKAKLGSYSGGLEVTGKATNGQLLEVNIQFQPTAPNNGTSFSVFSRWIGTPVRSMEKPCISQALAGPHTATTHRTLPPA